MSETELLKQCATYSANCAAMVEDAVVRVQRNNRIAQEKKLYSTMYQKGDLVLVRLQRFRPGVATRLRYQSSGPWEVLGPPRKAKPREDGSHNAYRLRHLASGKEMISNVKYILPYISKEAFQALPSNSEKEGEDSSPDSNEAAPVFEPKEGSFVLLPNNEDEKPWFLLKVLEKDGERLTCQYLNSTSSNPLRGQRLCWKHSQKAEIQSNRPPAQAGYMPWTDVFLCAELCQREMSLKPVGTGKYPKCYLVPPAELASCLEHPAL